MNLNHSSDRIFTNDNCTGCNRCITACTIPEANVAVVENGENKIYIDGDKCIGCAKCIEACPRDARDYRDDTDAFLDALQSGKEISALVAPAVRSNFPDFKKLLGLLHSLGVKQIYDTSFGADICTWAYLKYITEKNAKGLISQPCPVVVNYIEKHDAALIPKLAPLHSPATCCAVYMKKYKNIPGEYAFISPCIAKKEEFSDPNTDSLVKYNVTFNKLMEALKKRGIDYRSYQPAEFDNDKHGLGCIYPMPGGLRVNVEQAVPDAWVYQVEGQPEVVHFLDHYAKGGGSSSQPLLVDILNCAKGCNMGTGALCDDEDGISVSKSMYDAEHEALAPKSGKKPKKQAAPGLQPPIPGLNHADFIRRYNDKTVQPIPVSSSAVEKAYHSMYKYSSDERHVDCCSCGFSACEDMAKAIAKGINHPENCVEYHKSVLQHRQDEIGTMLDQQNQMSEQLSASVGQIFDSMQTSSKMTEETVAQVSQINEEISGVKEIANKLNNMVEQLRGQIDDYVSLASEIVKISMQTKLMSMNASVEAAHAREHGKGFAVLAEEMKTLSDQSESSAKEIQESNSNVMPILNEVASFSEDLRARTQSIMDNTEKIQRSIRAISETEQGVVEAASRLRSGSGTSEYQN